MIYLDSNATTIIDPQVYESMDFVINGEVGNPSSLHRHGQKAKGLLATSKRRIASCFKVQTDELVFTSGATEALNMVICSAPQGSHIITSSLEHASIIEPLKFTQCAVTYLDPEPGQGAIGVHQVEEALSSNTSMIIVTAANNETGIKTDIEAMAALAFEAGVRLVVDGVVTLGKEVCSIPKGVWAICFSGHKIHGPTGIGLAVVRKSFELQPLIWGGPQQLGRRAGTEPLAGIVGLAKAIELIDEVLPLASEQMRTLRDRFEQEMVARLANVSIHGVHQPRVCNTTNMAFEGMDGETLLMSFDLAGLAASHGAACSSGALEPSRVLLNMGLSMEITRGSIRFSLSRFTTEAEIDRAIEMVSEIVTALRDKI